MSFLICYTSSREKPNNLPPERDPEGLDEWGSFVLVGDLGTIGPFETRREALDWASLAISMYSNEPSRTYSYNTVPLGSPNEVPSPLRKATS